MPSNHLFFSYSIKVNKYGDRVLETIEAFIKQYKKTDKNKSSSSHSSDSIKRRREAAEVSNRTSNDYEDFTESTARSKKRAVKSKKTSEIKPVEIDEFNECMDDDLDFDVSVFEYQAGSLPKKETNANGRKLPTWSQHGKQ